MIALIGSWILARGGQDPAELEVVASLEESGLPVTGLPA
jgi:hypothetical protein